MPDRRRVLIIRISLSSTNEVLSVFRAIALIRPIEIEDDTGLLPELLAALEFRSLLNGLGSAQ